MRSKPMDVWHTGKRRIHRLGALTLAVALVTACQPKDETPGLWLRGETVEGSVGNWSFSEESEEIFIETSPWYGLPHSTTIWCVALDGALYIGSYGEEKKAWERNIERDAEARISIASRVYDVTVTPVRAAELIEALDEAYASKYDMADVFGEEVPDWRYYGVAQRDRH